MSPYDPYKIQPPALMSFSGGRTSAFMLRQITRAHGGTLPAGVEVCFFNTGKERPPTLDFVEDCSRQFGAAVTWLEYDRVQDELGGWHNTYRIVDHGTASREGEPFAKLIRARSYLPNVVTRFCTSELKVRLGKKFMLSRGHEHWVNAVGIRADEPGRLGGTSDSRERWERVHPLADAGVVLEDVMAFWQGQRGGMDLEAWLKLPAQQRPGWDLGLLPHEGNCDLCFLKGRQKLIRIINDQPRLADWWVEQERDVVERTGKQDALTRFNRRGTYEELVEYAMGGPLFAALTPPPQTCDWQETDDCNCTD